MNNTEFVKEICERLDFPAEARTVFLGVEWNLEKNAAFAASFERLVRQFCRTDEVSLRVLLPRVERLAKKYKENKYTMDLVFIMHLSKRTRERYREQGLPDELFWASMTDLKYKLLECMACKNVPGTFVAGWNEGFLRLGRFTLGRFQYEPDGVYHGEDLHLECGLTVKDGARYAGFHIPSSGQPLTDDVRSGSYRMAYEFMKEKTRSDIVLLRTHSWLLYPGHREFLPPTSNILRFMDDFEIYESGDSDEFGDAWRVFNQYAELPVTEWPEDTSLRRAFKARLLSGGKTGSGGGFIVMYNGENVTHKKDFFTDRVIGG
ncbi:MAG: DUF5596 domain-containing protein [Clostridia bacterium]|nr:DUF5596 domain-containing protein [Clostridia bacterium]